jgi:hypothetical protein
MDPNTTETPDKQPTVSYSDGSTPAHSLIVLQPGEKIICEIKRHPAGVLVIYFWAVLAVAAITVVTMILGPKMVSQTAVMNNSSVAVMQAVGVFVDALIVLGTFAATIVYWRNRWVVTDDSITQIAQNSLFSGATSQIPMQNIEDVTVERRGFWQTIFNYGTLTLQSAGEQEKFLFLYCPNPHSYARTILETHEAFISRHSLERHIGH